MQHQCFAVCTPGLEPFVATELAALGVRRIHTTSGGVTFDATTRQVYAANVWLRVATRVLVRAGHFRARDFRAFEAKLAELPWDGWLSADLPVRVRATSTRSQLYHTGAIEERVLRVLGAQSARDSDVGQLVVVRIVRDMVTVSVDSSGASLHKRGWRQQATRASLRETLAAAMLLATDWSSREPLVDPFCGSGTVAIEAALMAAGRAPGAARHFAFEQWTSFEPGTWASVRGDIDRANDAQSTPVAISARDRDDGAVEIARANAARAGVLDALDIRRATISELADESATSTGWIVTNPPYGRRLSRHDDLRNLYARLGDVVRASRAGWGVGLLVADPTLAGHTRLPLSARFHTSNGGTRVHYLVGRVGDAAVAS
jgi:putative N6-adenine-specific DNA methylase